jgi:hypothetical protein
MADVSIPVATSNADVLLDAVSVGTGAGTVIRELVSIGDPVDGFAKAAVSSTFATVTSYALVTRLVAAPANRQAQGLVSSVGNVVSTSVDGTAMSIISLRLTSTQMIAFESSNDGGITWGSTNAYQMPAGTATTSAASSGVYAIPNVMGSDSIRARVASTAGGGSTTANIQCNAGAGIVYVVQPTAASLNVSTVGGVAVISVVPGTAATNLGKAGSSAAAIGDTGVAAMYVRRDAPAFGALVSSNQYVAPSVDRYGRTWVNPSAFQFINVSSATVTTAASSNAYLAGITVNATAATGSVTIYNNSSAAGSVVGTINCSSAVGNFPYGVQCSSGITVSTAGAPDITVRYNY